MRQLVAVAVAVQIAFLTIVGEGMVLGFVSQDERKCKYLRADKLLKIRCYDMNLKEVPPYLKASVEVLDLSFNRIKKLRRSSFQPYGNVKYLLLYENMIQSVEAGTFEHLTSLQEIDLSNNALTTIPLELFRLPSLRNLYVDSNELLNLERDLGSLTTPIEAPLEYLNVADCGLENLPDLGPLPKLWHINASMNPLTQLSLDRLASMCHLKSVDLTKTSMDDCTCQQVNGHLHYLAVKATYAPICLEALTLDVCPPPYNETIESASYRRCESSAKLAQARSIWLFASGCLGGALLVLAVVLYCVHRRRRMHAMKERNRLDRKHFVISPKNAINNHQSGPGHALNDELIRCDSASSHR